ncbi:hypothetical protein ACJDU8_07620 [Clostridium sp. WILCCON 0269]|uniref:DUF2642 domain-containing protein n=1 Tax=Candidatus Clostridium eludens TaxID=3381663 RepID=A0ABW8SHD5_9CLOT
MSRHHRRKHSRRRHSEQDSLKNLLIDNSSNSLIESNPSSDQSSEECSHIESISFIDNLKRYIGEIVTISTPGADFCQCNSIGTLIEVNNYFIRLAIKPDGLPIYTSENTYSDDLNINNQLSLPTNDYNLNCTNNDTGALVDIPIDKITAFTHSGI